MDSRIKQLFERYRSGKANSDEKQLVEDWFAAFDSKEQKKFSEEQKTMLFAKMDLEMGKLTENHHSKSPFSVRWLQVAAILLVGAGITWFKIRRKVPVSQISYTLISAPKGFKKKFSLPDGSVVFLNSGSSLRISSNFAVKDRLVILSGEGFFDVIHNPKRPFSIQSGRLVITDVGTSFNVRAYPGENLVKVAVESGEVNVKSKLKQDAISSRSVTNNQQLTYNNESRRLILNTIPTNEISDWKENKLRFDNASFSEISASLERCYNVTIKLNGLTEKQHRYTVSFNNEPVSKVLNVLAKLSGMSYQINNKTIQINLKPNKNI